MINKTELGKRSYGSKIDVVFLIHNVDEKEAIEEWERILAKINAMSFVSVKYCSVPIQEGS